MEFNFPYIFEVFLKSYVIWLVSIKPRGRMFELYGMWDMYNIYVQMFVSTHKLFFIYKDTNDSTYIWMTVKNIKKGLSLKNYFANFDYTFLSKMDKRRLVVTPILYKNRCETSMQISLYLENHLQKVKTQKTMQDQSISYTYTYIYYLPYLPFPCYKSKRV